MSGTSLISLSEVIKFIDSGLPFNLTVITADRRRGTGGERLRVVSWLKSKKEPGEPANPAESTVPKSRIAKALRECNPDHFQHKTRNIYNPKNREIRKIHLKLIVEFNGRNVVL